MLKTYICPRWPEYSLSGKIKFEGGWFKTEDSALQELIESNDMWEVYIWDATGESHVRKTETTPEAGTDSEALREEVSNDGQEGGEGLPAVLEDRPKPAPRPRKGNGKRSDPKGRAPSDVFQELESVVRGSGLFSGQGGAIQPGFGEGGSGSAIGTSGTDKVDPFEI